MKSLREVWEQNKGAIINFAREYQFPRHDEEYMNDMQFYNRTLREMEWSSEMSDLRIVDIKEDGERITYAVQWKLRLE